MILVLMFALLPVGVSAEETEAEKIQKQVRSTYLTALYRSGRKSFNGYCGALVSWQTFLLGIDTVLYGCNGKDQFDQYKNMGTTTGGYRVRSYPAGKYQLRSALQEITQKGTADVYNLLVGFQRTNTQEGSIYGHAVFIHGIIDGIVYYTECYSASIDGKYWGEGTTISCTVDAFCQYYNSWTVFEGVIYFGHKNYAEDCKQYPTAMYGIAVKDSVIYSQPFDAQNPAQNETEDILTSGQIVKVTALLETPGGEYWYALEGQDAYVPADTLVYASDCLEDITLTGAKMPTVHTQGKSFSLGGTVASSHSGLSAVRVDVYSMKIPDVAVLSAQVEVSGNRVVLNDEALEKVLRFGDLIPGEYGISVIAQGYGYVMKQGLPEMQIREKTLWNSRFRVVSQGGDYVTVTFDGNGGTPSQQQMVVAAGEILTLPNATGTGLQLLGWSTDPEGFQMVDVPFVADQNITLYARWTDGTTGETGWHLVYDSWQYYMDGARAEGWFTFAGMKFYQLPSGIMVRGWREIDGKEYYFSETGRWLSGWQEISGSRYYLYEDGGKAVGRVVLDGHEYSFEEDGRMMTQWVSSDENVDLLNHSWDSGRVMKEPALGQTGEMVYQCDVCFQERTEEIPALTLLQVISWWGILLIVLGGVITAGGVVAAVIVIRRKKKEQEQNSELPVTQEQ